jgi:hypothetical protein
MQAEMLGKQLLNFTIAHSGAETRGYLGMSAIGQCPARLYREIVQGREWTTQSHLYCYVGYLFEQSVIERLKVMSPALLGPSREFSDFHGRFMGHSDGSFDGDLLEIKSITATKMAEIDGHIPHNHYWQVQTYMRYGGYKRAQVVYVTRDSGEMKVVEVRFNERVAELARLKAASILEAVDRREPPECECGWCNTDRRGENGR